MKKRRTISKPEYFINEVGAKAFNAAFLQMIADRRKEVVAQYISPGNSQRFRHRGGWVHPGAPEVFSVQPRPHSSTIETQFQNLVDNDLSTIHRNVQTLCDALHRQFSEMLISTMSSVCEETGNTVDARAAGSVENAIIEMFEKIQFVANKKGEVKPPDLHASPETAARVMDALSTSTPEFKQRLEDVMRRKTEDAKAAEIERKARFAHYGSEA